MMTLDPNESFFQEDDSHSRDDDLKNAKDSQLYKDTMALLKRKMCTAQDLLEQFNHKVKEYDDLNLELHESKLDKEKLFNKYNSASEKLTRLELSNRDNEKSRNDFKNTAEKQKLELDEKMKHIEQLEFKIKEMEKDSFRLKDEIKKLQQENKIAKTVAKKSTKNQGCQTNLFKQQDASVNTDFKKESPKKPQVRHKNTITDEVTNAEKDRLPILCSKCENEVYIPPVGQILKFMSSTPPSLVTNPFSPPGSPRSIRSCPKQSESIASNTSEQYFHENLEPNCFDKRMIEMTRRTDDETSGPSFMLIHKLTKRINNLEQKMKKKKQKQEKCCHKSCSSSKNIKFVVQLPNEEKYIKLAKQQRRKEARLKRLKKNQIKLKNKKRTKTRGWQVENHAETQNTESSLQQSRDQSEQKYRNIMRVNEADLFESPAILVPTSNNQAKLNSCTSENMQTPQTESHSTLDTNTSDSNKRFSNSTNKVLVLDDVNKDECNVQSSTTVLVHTNYHENNVKEAIQSMKCDSKEVLQTNFNESNLSLDVLKEGSSDKTVDPDSQNFNDVVLMTEESDSAFMDTKNVDKSREGLEMKETVVEATIPQVSSKQEKQENNEEPESPHDSIRRVSISSEILSENDEILPASVHTSTDEDASMDAVDNKSEQNNFQEVDNAKNTLRSLDEIVLSSPEKIEATDSPTSRRSSRSSIKNSVEKKENSDDNICESVEESDQSSDDSLNSKCSTAIGNKRTKFSSIIDTDDSSEENLDSKNFDDKNEHRKMLLARRKKLLSKIRNLRKTSKKPMVSNIKMEKKTEVPKRNMVKKTEVCDDTTPIYMPTKKQRVAHKPKDPNEVVGVASAKDVSQISKGTCETQTTERNNTLSKPKPFSRTRKAKAVKDMPCTTKKPKLMENVKAEENHEKQCTTVDVEKYDSTLDGSESLEMAITDEGNESKMEISYKDNDQDKNDQEKKDQTDEHSKLDLSASSKVIEMKTDSTENCSTSVANKDSSTTGEDESIQDNESINDSNKNFSPIDDGPEEIPIRKLRCRNVVAEKPARTRRVSTRLKESQPPVTKSDTDTNIVSTPSDSEKTVTKNDTDTNVVPTPSDCQKSKNDTSTKVISAPSGGKQSKKKKKQGNKQPVFPKIDSNNSSLPDTPILSQLNEFLLESRKEYKPENGQYLRNNERQIREQLSLLMKSEPLTNDVLTQVTEKLLSVDQLDVIALVLVEYAATEYEDDIKCDTTFTPPAPPMTKFEQKLVTLIMNMKDKQPEFVDAVEKGLQYKLFRLGNRQEVQIVERLFRLLVVLNKIKKDREKVRMLFCDALYSFNTRAINMIHVTLSCWPEVLPKHDPNNDILVKTMVHIIMSTNVNKPFSKLLPLKKLLSDFYGYPNAGYRVENFKVELMNNLKENVPGINTAILLLCKSKGSEWTLENIVKGIKEMVVNHAHPSPYDALTLLGNVLRPMSGDHFKKNLEEINDQLCDVLAGGSGVYDLDEGIVSCLLNLGGKFPFTRHKIAQHVLNWNCSQDLRPTTKEKFDSFLKTHNPGWWRKFVRQNFPAAEKR